MQLPIAKVCSHSLICSFVDAGDLLITISSLQTTFVQHNFKITCYNAKGNRLNEPRKYGAQRRNILKK